MQYEYQNKEISNLNTATLLQKIREADISKEISQMAQSDLQPIVALLGGFLVYKERVSISTLLAIGISIIGVVMVGWGDLGQSSESVIMGDILSFLSVLAVVGYLLIGQNRVKRISHWIYSFCAFFFASLALALYNLITGVPTIGYDTHEWGVFLLLAIFLTIAHVIYNFLMNYVNTATISMSILGEPIGATILAVILFLRRTYYRLLDFRRFLCRIRYIFIFKKAKEFNC